MIRKCLAICFLLFSSQYLSAQQYGLFNTKTLFDGFENPAQKTFLLDSSRQFASNFFLPYLGTHAVVNGNESVLRNLLKEGLYTAADVPLNKGQTNNIFLNTNIYLLNLKIFRSYKFHKEIGLSWQLRADANIDYTNETLAIFDDYRRFINEENPDFSNAFNNQGYAQSYHQFSLSYRENYNKQLSFGVKLSLLSGIIYNKVSIDRSFFSLESGEGPMHVGLRGNYLSSFRNGDELKKSVTPFFKNPGASISLGATYTSKKGLFMMANIKDLGFIRWSKDSYVNNFDNTANPISLDSLQDKQSHEIEDAITGILIDGGKRSIFHTPINAKVDFLISKTFGFYTPSLIVSKNLFFNGGDVAVVNRFYNKDFSVSFIPAYNFNNVVFVGMQGMYQTPNFEVFVGSDNILKTSSLFFGGNNNVSASARSHTGASIYLGASIKFGYIVEHPKNSSYMPGVGGEEQGFFKRLFGVFKNKRK